MNVMRFLPALLLFCLAMLPAHAAPEEFDTPLLVRIEGYEDNAMEPFVSRDGEWLFFNNRNEPEDQTDLHYARRVNDREFVYQGLIQDANSTSLDGVASLDTRGNFYFISPRNYENSRNTLWQGRFQSGRLTDLQEVGGDISRYKPLWLNMDAEISANGNRLYVVENEWRLFGGGIKSSNIFVARRARNGEFFRTSQLDQIMTAINTSDLEYAPALTPDELTLYFTRVDPLLARKGDNSAFGIWVAQRSNVNDPFGAPVKIEAIEGFVEAPTIAEDGCAIYFHQKVRDVFRIMRADRTDCSDN